MENEARTLDQVPDLRNDRILRLGEVMRKVGVGKTSIYEGVHKGTFPAPIKLGPRASGWLQSEVEAWLQERIEQSRGAA